MRLERTSDGIAQLELCTDAAPHLDRRSIAALREAAAAIAADSDIRAVVVVGGARKFCLGAPRETLVGPDAAAAIAELTESLPRTLLSIPVPTIAAIAGHAIGGGFALPLWCDFALFGDVSLYAANFVGLGFTPGMGATVIVEHVFGGSLGAELLYTGKTIQGRELAAAAPQIAHRVHPRAAVVERAHELATEIAQASRRAVVELKRSRSAHLQRRLDAALVEERAMHDASFADPATRARIAEAYVALEEA